MDRARVDVVSGFEWTVLGTSEDGKNVVWAIQCESCDWATELPGIERLEPDEQASAVNKVTAGHRCSQPRRP